MRTAARLASTSMTAAWCHWNTAFSYRPQISCCIMWKLCSKRDSLAWVRGRFDVMADLARHKFIGPSLPVLHFRSTTDSQRSQTPYSEPPTCLLCAEDTVEPGQISTKVSPQPGVLSVCLEGSFCAQPACPRKCWPEEPGFGTRREILHPVRPSYFKETVPGTTCW
ncbi:hypothetical protein KVR01_002114 [Diaporthe batatas]|uniref:uncharacterized protein n=1 Tax=Diaporthe batatas TaxID=748121 RepID=UPI001D0567A2|nr:uncharacterized protein KVR01_002114 [Diaporthe batatas]KAG8166425.1 hypothetical protein KVR01_002114 [Diaporthe batatas]